MAHFYGRTQGNRGEATRCGSKNSGLVASADGWEIGGTVKISYSPVHQTDVISFTLDSGSGYGKNIHLGSFIKKGDTYQLISKSDIIDTFTEKFL